MAAPQALAQPASLDYDRRVAARVSEQESFEITEGYTKIREIGGDYLMREVELN